MSARQMLTLVAWFSAASLSAASVSAQGPPSSGPAIWRTQFDFGLNSSSGNSSLTTVLVGASLRRLETERIELEISANYRYGRSRGHTISDFFRSQLKFDINPQARWSPFLFGANTRDPVRRIQLRVQGGAGAKYTFWRTPRGKSSVSMATIYNYEDFTASGGESVPTEKLARWSARAKLNLYFGEGVEYEHITFYQPVWNDLADYYVLMNNSLRVPVTRGLSLIVRHEYRHDQTPASGVKVDDAYLAVVFRYVF